MALRDLLRPWHTKLLLTSTDEHGDGTLWFSIGTRPKSEDALVATLEGLELITWLQLVSVDALDAVVNDLWPNASRQKPIRQVGISLDASTASGYAAVSACFLSRTSKRSPSTLFLEARSQIQQQLGSRVSPPPCIAVHVLVGGSASAFKRTLRCIVGFARIERSAPVSVDVDRWFNLRVTQIDLNQNEYYVVDEQRLAQLTELVAHGVTVKHCRQPQFEISTPASARDTFFRLQALLETGDPIRSSGLRDLMLNPDYLPDEMVSPVCSAIASSRSLQKLRVGLTDRCRRHKTMQWLCLAIFSDLAHNSIKCVEIDVDDCKALQGLVDVVTSDNPLGVVFTEHAFSIQGHKHLRAAASRLVLLIPTTRNAEGGATVDTHEHTDLRVLNHESNWWSVFLPGWGQAWVRDEDIVLTDTSRTLDPCVEGRAVSNTQLRWELRVQRAHAGQLDWLADTCTLLQLRGGRDIVELHIVSPTPFPAGFMTALCDPSHRMTQSLRSLYVNCEVMNGRDVHELATQLARVLQRKQHLALLHLHIRWYAYDGSFDTQELMAHHGSAILSQPELRQKLAFLSVLWNRTMRTSSRLGASIEQLDSAIVGSIFLFTYPRSAREVSVTIESFHLPM